jgi:hypothetical protein
MSRAPSIYRVDRRDRIVDFNDGFRSFAADNGAGALPERVLGRSLFSFIAGVQVPDIWRHLVERVRRGKPLEGLRCRCDSPDVRRVISIDVRPWPHGHVEFEARLVAELARERLALLEYRHPNGSMLEMCNWCLRVRLDGWVDVEQAVRRLGLLEGGEPPGIAHGLCDECRARLLGDLSEL